MAKFIRHAKFYVYIVQCRDKTYYTGYTPDLKKRIKLHNDGKGAKYTKNRRPVKLVWFKEYKYFKTAFKKELEIKKMPRTKKTKLIEDGTAGDFKISRRKNNIKINSMQI